MSKTISHNDFVYTIKDNNIMSGGYKINSDLINNKNPLFTYGGGNLLVPIGLNLSKTNKETFDEEITKIYNDEIVTDDLYDRLLKIVDPINIKKSDKKTRKIIKKSLRATRKR
jgi:ABC-type microcin C transport system permease subunit YejE